MFVWPTGHVGMMHPSGGPKARAMLSDFLSFGEAAEADISYNDAKSMLSVSTNQAETRKSFFEELALLYVPYRSNRVILTPLGRQLFKLLYDKDLSNLSREERRKATSLIVWSACRSQINRPHSRGVPRPKDEDWKNCDIRPYATAWLAIRELDGLLFLHEFMGVLRKVRETSEFDDALTKIRNAREQGTRLASDQELSGKPEMNYRIYWKSHLTVAEQILTAEGSDDEEHFEPVAESWDIVLAALRFLSGCGNHKSSAIQATGWADVDEYFEKVAGAPCPPFLASGSPTIKSFDGQTLADLSSMSLTHSSSGDIFVTGGPELCQLSMKLPCFHPSSTSRLLRVDEKVPLADGTVRLRLGMGRPIVSLSVLKKVLEGKNDK